MSTSNEGVAHLIRRALIRWHDQILCFIPKPYFSFCCVLNSYKSKLHNITDTLLLVDLNFLIALLYNRINDPLSNQFYSSILIHALITIPFVCVLLSLICLLLINCGIYECVRGCGRNIEQNIHQPKMLTYMYLIHKFQSKKYAFLTLVLTMKENHSLLL